MTRWEKFLVFFESGGCKVSPRFHVLFLMLISSGTKERDGFNIIWHGHEDGNTFLTFNASCSK